MSSSSTEPLITDAEQAAESNSINSNPTETQSSTQYSCTPDSAKTSKKSDDEEDKNKDDSAFLCNIW